MAGPIPRARKRRQRRAHVAAAHGPTPRAPRGRRRVRHRIARRVRRVPTAVRARGRRRGRSGDVERSVDDPDRLKPCRVSVALSGGGHRASAWGIGALYGLLKTRDAERDKGADARPFEFTSVASVSGGSITNGVVARETDLGTVSADGFRTALGPLIETVATKGLIPARGR